MSLTNNNANMSHTAIKSFEDACRALNTSEALPDVTGWQERDRKYAIANYKLVIINRALNGDWEADYSDASQRKYWPWFYFTAGSGFSCHDCGCDYASATVGARLSFKTAELARYAAETFKELYNDLLSL